MPLKVEFLSFTFRKAELESHGTIVDDVVVEVDVEFVDDLDLFDLFMPEVDSVQDTHDLSGCFYLGSRPLWSGY